MLPLNVNVDAITKWQATPDRIFCGKLFRALITSQSAGNKYNSEGAFSSGKISLLLFKLRLSHKSAKASNIKSV